MRQNSLVKHMQRVPHVHTYRNYTVINGRDVCDSCPYRIPRWKIHKPLGTKREMYDFEKRNLLAIAYPKLTADELRFKLRDKQPNRKGISKMRKPELVSALLELVK